MIFQVVTNGLIQPQLHQTHLGEGQVGSENSGDSMGHLGEHHSELDGEAGEPANPEHFGEELMHLVMMLSFVCTEMLR